MDAGTAQKYHFKVGQSVRILFCGAPRGLHHHRHRPVRRLPNNLAGATIAAFDPPDRADNRSGEVGQLDDINVVAEAGR